MSGTTEEEDIEKEEQKSLLTEDSSKQSEEKGVRSPLRSVKDVLREAEGIFAEEKAGERFTKEDQGQVIMDQVDVHYSPHKNQQPIEIIVRHNKIVSHDGNSDSDDDSPFSTRAPFETIMEEVETVSDSKKEQKKAEQEGSKKSVSFKKGHRRAWSMPSSNGGKEHIRLAVYQDQQQGEGSNHRRRIVRYRCNPRAGEEELPMPVTFEEIIGFNFDENELEVDINEEEIVYPADSEGKGRRTVVKRFWEARWKAQNFEYLPEWLQDNEYLRTGHRPPLPSFATCFKSIFALHSETGNIWTHMYGCVFFVGVAIWFLCRPSSSVQWQEKVVFSGFFFGAICCLGMSFAFHTVQCHSQGVGKLFSKLDYTGITTLIVGSFIPWIFYGFYCRPQTLIIYLSMIIVLGIAALIVSLWDKFAEPKFRPVRAGVFVAMGLSSVIPAFHLLLTDGLNLLYEEDSIHWLVIMGIMYLIGATIYATRVPERCFPGKCDLWFQSHQLFHSFVIIAAAIHLHGVCQMAVNKLQLGSCPETLLDKFGIEEHFSHLGSWLGLEQPPGLRSWTPEMRPTVIL